MVSNSDNPSVRALGFFVLVFLFVSINIVSHPIQDGDTDADVP